MYGDGLTPRSARYRSSAGLGKVARGPLRDLHLHDVAGEDVLLGAAHRVEKTGLGKGTFELRRPRCPLGGRFLGKRDRQTAAQRLQPRAGAPERVGLPRIGVHDEIELAEHVVHDRHLVGDQQQHIRGA
jgi:hypothetical protein